MFKQQKKKQLEKADKSSIGSWDDKILGLCERLNDMDDYYTTSSCAGRIVLIKDLDKKARDVFLYRTHEITSLKEIKEALENIEYEGLVEFQQTSCILHVACSNIGKAQELVNKAKNAGMKHSGIMNIGSGKKNKIMVELYSTERMAFPIMNNKKVLVSDEFLEIAIKEANRKLERTWKKIEKLEENLSHKQ